MNQSRTGAVKLASGSAVIALPSVNPPGARPVTPASARGRMLKTSAASGRRESADAAAGSARSDRARGRARDGRHVGGITVAQANHAGDEVTGHTTTQVTICPNESLCPTDDFTFLRAGPGEPHVVRQEFAGAAGGRANRRRSLAYFAQISDFQLADEESPARVEAVDDEPSGTASSAWRPQEAMVPHEADRTIRQVNRFLKSTIRQGNGARVSMLNAVLTGDFADSQQRNEDRVGGAAARGRHPRPVERDEGPQRPWMPARRSGRSRLRQPPSL